MAEGEWLYTVSVAGRSPQEAAELLRAAFAQWVWDHPGVRVLRLFEPVCLGHAPWGAEDYQHFSWTFAYAGQPAGVGRE